MKNYFLKFTNEAEFTAKFLELGLATVEPVWGTESDTQFITKITTDVIGLIYKPTGQVLRTEDNLQYPEMLPIDGWHVNIKADLTAEQEAALPLITAPTTPYRIWAGE
jgi:hypothetical protein